MLLNYKMSVIVFSITEVICVIQLVTNQIKRKVLYIEVIQIK